VTSLLPFWTRWKRNPVFELWRKRLVRWLLAVEFLLNLITCSLLLLVDEPFTGLRREQNSTTAGWTGKIVLLCFATILILLQCALNLACSLRLIHKISGGSFRDVLDERGRVVSRVPREDVTLSFLLSSYLSAVLLFACVYFFLFAFAPSHEFSVDRQAGKDQVHAVWFAMIYFSMTAMTGVGFGDFFARGVLSRLVCMAEMLLSIGYTSIFIGLGMWVMC